MEKPPYIVLVPKLRPERNPTRGWKGQETILAKELRENRPNPIDYATCKIEPLERALKHLGERVRVFSGTYYLDGKRVLVGDLIRLAGDL